MGIYQKGFINSYSYNHRKGVIAYKVHNRAENRKYNNFLSFDYFSVDNPSEGIHPGKIVSFKIRKNRNGDSVAVDINIKPDDIVRSEKQKRLNYINQNWEELEKILEGDFASAKVNQIAENEQTPDKTSIYNQLFPYESTELGLAVIDNKIRLVNLTKDGRFNFLDQAQKRHNILYPSFLKEASMEIAIEEFEDLINSILASENDFQNFFKRNPQFILDENYHKAHSHVILDQENDRKLIPDFVLEPIKQNSFCDLLELKLPSSKIFVMKENRERYSSAIFEASAQLRTYSKYFDDRENREKFQQVYPHLKIYKPKLYIVIGRKNNEEPSIKREIENEFPNLLINNYDDLLERMIWRKKKIEEINKMFK